MTHQRTDREVIEDAKRREAVKRRLKQVVAKGIRGKGRGALKAAIERAATMDLTGKRDLAALEQGRGMR